MSANASTLIKRASPTCGWSNRILLLSLAGIFFLTLLPFRLVPHANLPSGASPFLLGGEGKPGAVLAALLNILLFMPLGFGLSEKLRERGWSRTRTFLAAWISGALLSYCIEFTQLYIPSRESRWEDVLTNQMGAIAGFVLFDLLGETMVTSAMRAESLLRASLTLRRVVVILVVYFAFWFGISARLQQETRLSNWSPQSQLVVGGDSKNGTFSPWRGTLSRIDLWDRAVPDELARSITAGQMPDGGRTGLVASYDFTSATSLEDQLGLLPPLSWTPHPPLVASSKGAAIDSRSWLTSSASVSKLADAVQKANQFSLRVVCIPSDLPFLGGRIVSIVQESGAVDLHLDQMTTRLGFWFRTPLSAGHPLLAWSVPDTFVAGEPRDILFSYDGSNLSLFVDGVKNPDVYMLGPGARFAELIRTPRGAELEGYNYIYDALIFSPAGMLVGLAAFRKNLRNVAEYLLFAIGFLLPPYVYERILSHVSGRPNSLESVFLCLVLFVGGALWIDVDRLLA